MPNTWEEWCTFAASPEVATWLNSPPKPNVEIFALKVALQAALDAMVKIDNRGRLPYTTDERDAFWYDAIAQAKAALEGK